ncbi:hypothetical protein CROQUDRAFT_46657 [Cronartium quercuum f. sp. fusiforme G11]|uniref:Caffeoyl-CoA O-methyltransferase n=1 Tax=Cronartium quercuum f. sp. fusiforme G11 TaxID=708437 RepID=A0A9P6NDS2_9BASI|nr:hypothetical protein CROQUDRAFT_46657 [Cronartium quercuum f. sp. fusiforme G11]
MLSVYDVCHGPTERVANLVTEARTLLKTSTSVPEPSETSVDQEKLDEILREAQAVAAGLDIYVDRCTNVPDMNAQSTKVIEEIINGANTTDWGALYASGQTSYRLVGAMSSNLYETGLMSFLTSLLRPRRVLEIGMFTGTMTTVFATTKSVERVIALECEPYLESWCRPYWKKAGEGVNEKIEVRIGSAQVSLETMAQNNESPFDFIFLDADKDSYLTYFRQIIGHKLLSKNGIMVIDNVLFRSTAYLPFRIPFLNPPGVDQATVTRNNHLGKFLNELNLEISKSPEVEVLMLAVRDGLTLVKWKDV